MAGLVTSLLSVSWQTLVVKAMQLIAVAAALVALGLVVWVTAWIAWPLALSLVAIGVVIWLRDRAHGEWRN